MAAPPSAYQERHFLAVIGDEVSQETVERRMILSLTPDIGLGYRLATCRHWGAFLPII